MDSSPTDQCIVLPFRPADPPSFSGAGLALHFLLGNVLVLHTGFKEMWFGWRVDNIFPGEEEFRRYCRGAGQALDLAAVAQAQKVHFWLHGGYSGQSVAARLFDAQTPQAPSPSADLTISTDDALVRFRGEFIDWMARLGRPMPPEQVQAALWPETIDADGLDAVGRALERFYIYSAYGGKEPLAIAPFADAAALAPASFMAHDLHGWALYRNRQYTPAKIAFLKSLRINPAGAGAMSGLMWCGVYAKDLEEAMYWSGRKADVCRRDVPAAREAGRRRYEKVNP